MDQFGSDKLTAANVARRLEHHREMMRELDEPVARTKYYGSYAERETVVPKTRDEFYAKLYEVLWSQLERWTETRSIMREMFLKHRIDCVVMAAQYGYACFEEMLHSKELEHVVTIESKARNLPEAPHYASYTYAPALDTNQFQEIQRRTSRKRTDINPESSYDNWRTIDFGLGPKPSPAPKVTEIKGTIVDYNVDYETRPSGGSEHNYDDNWWGKDDADADEMKPSGSWLNDNWVWNDADADEMKPSGSGLNDNWVGNDADDDEMKPSGSGLNDNWGGNDADADEMKPSGSGLKGYDVMKPSGSGLNHYDVMKPSGSGHNDYWGGNSAAGVMGKKHF